jgi:DNA-binding response OmpR family regulator
MNVLYVEDDLLASKVAIHVFEALNHNVIWCKSIKCAKACLKNGKIDLILLDMHLLGEHGTDLLEYLEYINSKIPVIIISGKIEAYSKQIDQFKKKGIVIGAYTKPLNYKGFSADIDALFSRIDKK